MPKLMAVNFLTRLSANQGVLLEKNRRKKWFFSIISSRWLILLASSSSFSICLTYSAMARTMPKVLKITNSNNDRISINRLGLKMMSHKIKQLIIITMIMTIALSIVSNWLKIVVLWEFQKKCKVMITQGTTFLTML